jgi:hypothetical protein
MTLRQFLDAAYYTLVENYQRGLHAGADIFEALKETAEWASGIATTASGSDEAYSERRVGAENDQALAEFESMMSGLGIGGLGA